MKTTKVDDSFTLLHTLLYHCYLYKSYSIISLRIAVFIPGITDLRNCSFIQ